MLSKRDLQLVRLACTRRWITAEQGEDVLALKTKFGHRLAIEEILRRQGYLDAKEVAELVAAANQVVSRRARPGAAPAPPEPKAKRPVPVAPSLRMERRPVSVSEPAIEAPRSPRAPVGDVTRFEMSPYADHSSDEPPEGAGDRTIIAPMDSMPDHGSAMDNDRTSLDANTEGLKEAIEAYRVRRAEQEAKLTGRSPPASSMPVVHTLDPAPPHGTEGPRRVGLPKIGLPAASKPGLPPAVSKASSVRTGGSAAVKPLPVIGGASKIERSPVVLRSPFAPSSPPAQAPPPPVLEISLSDAVAEDEGENERTVLAMHPLQLNKPRNQQGGVSLREVDKDPLANVPDAAYLSEPDSNSISMPGESLSSIMLGESPPPVPPEHETADAFQIGSLLEDEGAAEALLGPFGRFVLERVIARGSSSVVYLAQDSQLQQSVALKVFDGDPSAVATRISAESDALLAAANLESPYVVGVLDVGRVEGRYFIEMPYVDGWTLGEKLDADEIIGTKDALEMGRDVARALADCAAAGIVHGHVEPDAIFLTGERAMLGGVGKGKAIPGFADGKPAPALELGGDLLALGRVLYRVLTLKTLLPGQPIVDPRQHAPTLPEGAAILVLRLLQQGEPFGDAVQAAEALHKAAEDARGIPVLPREQRAPVELGRIALRAVAAWAGLIALAIVLPLLVEIIGLARWSAAGVILNVALAGAIALLLTTTLSSVLSLIRRGEIPLPMSSAWLVRLQESVSTAGSLVLVAGFSLAPPALLNLLVSTLAVLALGSGLFGLMLRRGIAAARIDRGIGRVLAVLGDPLLCRWRELHVPLVTLSTCLACARFALLAYFSAS